MSNPNTDTSTGRLFAIHAPEGNNFASTVRAWRRIGITEDGIATRVKNRIPDSRWEDVTRDIAKVGA